MICKLISKYGLAAHLGMSAAIPLVFAPFLTAGQLALTMLIAGAVFAFVWLLFEPSARAGEYPHNTRARVWNAIIRDPLFYFSLVVVVFNWVRWINSGIEVWYDAEQVKWLVREPAATVMPSSTGDAGLLPMITAIVMAVFLMAARHGLGLLARLFCSLTITTLVGIGGLVATICACLGTDAALVKAAHANFSQVPFSGTAYGFFLVLAIVSGMDAESKHLAPARLPMLISICGCAAGLILFAPPYFAILHVLVAIIFLIFSSFYCVRQNRLHGAGGVVRGVMFTILGVATPILLLMMFAPPELQRYKLQVLDPLLAFPVEYWSLREVLARISKGIWMAHPWLGSGTGTFGLQVPFFALKPDWTLLPISPTSAISGYWTILAERGIIGCGVLAIGLGLLLWSWGQRLVQAFMFLHPNDDADVFPFACPPIVWTAPFFVLLAVAELYFSPAFLLSANVFAFVVPLVLSAASFPRSSRS